MLVEALQGNSTNYRTGRWIGFQGSDLVAVIDMLQSTEVSSLTVRNAVVTGDWIFDASKIVLEASDDGSSYTLVTEETVVDVHTSHWAAISVHCRLSLPPHVTSHGATHHYACMAPGKWQQSVYLRRRDSTELNLQRYT